MPVYNEVERLPAAVKRVLAVDYPCDMELVVVDDGSTDGTTELYAGLSDDPRVTVHLHQRNRGKGAAIRTAAQLATGDYLLPCDADLEYSPEDIPQLVKPVLDGEAEVVYGTRAYSSHTAYSFWYLVGNKAVTMFANALYDVWISDLETCFKLLPTELYHRLEVKSDSFGMEAEITAKLLKRGLRPYEVPINYKARMRHEGKKLTWKDGVAAIWILTRIRFSPGRR
jgi:glycosyltransferase involved in cell wall biosynthesis